MVLNKLAIIPRFLLALIVLFSLNYSQAIFARPAEQVNYLITLSSGLFLGPDETLELRNTLVENFSNKNGDGYRHIIDLDDVTPRTAKISKKEIEYQFETLRVQLSNLKRLNSSLKVRIIMGLTAHGRTDEIGLYSLGFPDGQMSGTELLELLRKLSADSIVLILQSCQSGGLSNRVFVDHFMETHGKFSLAIIAPVSHLIYSAPFVWEREILRPSFKLGLTNRNLSSAISYSKWKDYIMSLGCLHQQYVPEDAFSMPHKINLPMTGIDPHITEYNIDDDFNLVEAEQVVPYQETRSSSSLTCREAKSFFSKLYTSSPQELVQIVSRTANKKKLKAIQTIFSLNESQQNELGNYVIENLSNDPVPEVRVIAVRLMKRLSLQQVQNRLLTLVGSEKNSIVLTNVLNILNHFKIYTATPLVQSIALEREYSSETRVAAISYLLQNYKNISSSFFLKVFLEDEATEVRALAAYALGLKEDMSVASALLSKLNNEPSWKLKSNIITALGFLKIQKIIPVFLKNLEASEWFEVRISAIDALVKLKAQEAINVLVELAKTESPSEIVGSAVLLKTAAINALGELEARNTAPFLRPMLKDRNALVRTSVVTTLTKIKDSAAVENFIEILITDMDSLVRQTTIQCLIVLNSKQAIPTLKKLAKDDTDEAVRLMAADAVKRLEETDSVQRQLK